MGIVSLRIKGFMRFRIESRLSGSLIDSVGGWEGGGEPLTRGNFSFVETIL
jgi:hypothetical protein